MGASASRVQPPDQPPELPPAQPPAPSFRSRVGGAVVQVPVAASLSYGFTGGTESEASSIMTQVEEEDDFSLSIDTLLLQRQVELDARIRDRPWHLQDGAGQVTNGLPIQEVLSPTASKIHYQLLHPGIYRYMEPMTDIEQVAQRLGAFGWRAEADRIRPAVDYDFQQFVGLPDSARETDVQAALAELIKSMAIALGRRCNHDRRTSALVRGTLARDHLQVRGVVDLVYRSGSELLFAAEVKTANSWPQDDTWYFNSRGTQLYQALYATNCPTLLVAQNQFKLFFENNDRNRVTTFPSKPTDGDARDAEDFRDTLCNQPTDDQLFDVLVICLLRAERMGPAVASPTRPAARAPQWSNNVNESTNSSPPKSRARANRARARDRRTGTARRVGGRAVPLPSFFTGVYDANGEPVFRTVHAELVEQFEPDSSCSDSDDALSSCDETPGSSGAVKAVLPTNDSAVAL